MRRLLEKARRIVVKVGSSSIVDESSRTILSERLDSIAEDICWLSKDHDKEVILMSSGALAWGRLCLDAGAVGEDARENRQVLGACGQIGIAEAWAVSFRKQKLVVGQLLLTPEGVASATVRSTLLSMLRNGIVPYLNENIPAMESYDNDGLSAEVAKQLQCDTLVLLSDVDGVYTANPMIDANAMLVPVIDDIDAAIRRFGGDSASGLGTGGMLTKLRAARTMRALGVETLIASGDQLNPLRALTLDGSGTVIPAHSSVCRVPRSGWHRGR